jgi:hypothetical protein
MLYCADRSLEFGDVGRASRLTSWAAAAAGASRDGWPTGKVRRPALPLGLRQRLEQAETAGLLVSKASRLTSWAAAAAGASRDGWPTGK